MRWFAFVLLSLVACGTTPPPESPAPKPVEPEHTPMPESFAEELDTGNDCVTAEAECAGGVCTAKIKNACEVPVTCEFDVLVLCQSETDAGEAKGKGRDTFPAGTDGEIVAGSDCEGRGVRATSPENLSCR